MVHVVNAFVKNGRGGNPAGVMLLDMDLSDVKMLQIAKFMGFSETAFVRQLGPKIFKLRFFTPADEVDLCGHATIATFTLLKALGKVTTGHYIQETKAGSLAIEVLEDGVFMEMATPTFHGIIDPAIIAPTLGIKPEDILENYPIQCVSTGLKDILVPLVSLNVLENLKPDFEAIEKTSKDNQVVGYHVFAFETADSKSMRVRNFAPLYDIDEEAATGTSNGALMAYLKRYNPFCPDKMVFEQGYEMQIPSEICVYTSASGAIFVGGEAVVVSKKELPIDLLCDL